MDKKILIANRGEIALRIIQTCKEMGIGTVAVYSTADKDSLHVKYADESICIGPPESALSYLNYNNILTAAKITKASGIHPGYGFLAENPDFAEICGNEGIKFIGPSPSVIKGLGTKSLARTIALAQNIDVILGSSDVIENVEVGIDVCRNIGYPVIIKASGGGGGRGMRIVEKEENFIQLWTDARKEALVFFGNPDVYIEKYLSKARHIEVQIIADSHGNIATLSERECSIQRRHQKLIEECPSVFISSEIRKTINAAAIKIAKAVGYEGLGTVEFLIDEDSKPYFMEVNTRIQVEHTVTEEALSIDLVREQINIADGGYLEDHLFNSFPANHSIECRINAEDPDNFIPSPGTIIKFNKPGGNGVRVDSHVYTGYNIPLEYDSMIAKVITTASSRRKCIAKMIRALSEFEIEGIKTTIPFHLKILRDHDFVNGDFDTQFIENKFKNNK